MAAMEHRVAYRRTMRPATVDRGLLPLKCASNARAREIVRAMLRQHDAEGDMTKQVDSTTDGAPKRYPVELHDAQGRIYTARLDGLVFKGRQRQWELKDLREWMIANNVRGGTVVELRQQFDGRDRFIIEVVQQLGDLSASQGPITGNSDNVPQSRTAAGAASRRPRDATQKPSSRSGKRRRRWDTEAPQGGEMGSSGGSDSDSSDGDVSSSDDGDDDDASEQGNDVAAAAAPPANVADRKATASGHARADGRRPIRAEAAGTRKLPCGFDRRLGKVVSASDTAGSNLSLTVDMYTGQGVFAALMGRGVRLRISLRHGDASWTVELVTCKDRKPARLNSMGFLYRTLSVNVNDVILFAPVPDSDTAFAVSILPAASAGAGTAAGTGTAAAEPQQRGVGASGAGSGDDGSEENVPLATRMAGMKSPVRGRSSAGGGGSTQPPPPPSSPAQQPPATIKAEPADGAATGATDAAAAAAAASAAAEQHAPQHTDPSTVRTGATGGGAAARNNNRTARAGSSWRPVSHEHIASAAAASDTAGLGRAPSGPTRARTHDNPRRIAATGAAEATAAAPPPAAYRPAASITHLHGCLPSSVARPAVQSDELQVCGLVFHPDLRACVLRIMEEWLAGLGCALSRADAVQRQLQIPGIDPALPPAAAEAATAAASRPWVTAFTRNKLSRNVICNRLARLLGLTGEGGSCDASLPSDARWLADSLQGCADADRGGAGLQATKPIKKNAVLGVMGGYVLPCEGRVEHLSYSACSGPVRAELVERMRVVGKVDAADCAWNFLSYAFEMPYIWPKESFSSSGQQQSQQQQQGSQQRELDAVMPPALLSMLGYGGLGALVNDPRVEPRAWVSNNDVEDAEGAFERANCLVLPVCVRGLVLPVLVALRDIAPGEQLMRDYGAGWWRQLALAWEVMEDEGLTPDQVLHGEDGPSCGHSAAPSHVAPSHAAAPVASEANAAPARAGSDGTAAAAGGRGTRTASMPVPPLGMGGSGAAAAAAGGGGSSTCTAGPSAHVPPAAAAGVPLAGGVRIKKEPVEEEEEDYVVVVGAVGQQPGYRMRQASAGNRTGAGAEAGAGPAESRGAASQQQQSQRQHGTTEAEQPNSSAAPSGQGAEQQHERERERKGRDEGEERASQRARRYEREDRRDEEGGGRDRDRDRDRDKDRDRERRRDRGRDGDWDRDRDRDAILDRQHEGERERHRERPRYRDSDRGHDREYDRPRDWPERDRGRDGEREREWERERERRWEQGPPPPRGWGPPPWEVEEGLRRDRDWDRWHGAGIPGGGPPPPLPHPWGPDPREPRERRERREESGGGSGHGAVEGDPAFERALLGSPRSGSGPAAGATGPRSLSGRTWETFVPYSRRLG